MKGIEEPANSLVWKLVLAYDGTEFHGWQVQPDCVTVQGELRDALARITGEEVLPQGSGRTDAGVHALGQVASFALAAPIPEANLARALNRTLPASIRVLSATRETSDFHARHSALAKTYEYRVFRGEICPPWLARYVYAFNAPLDVEAMQRAAVLVCGEHDFTSFAATDPDRLERDSDSTGEGAGAMCAASMLRSGCKRRRTICLFIACGAMASSITWCETWLGPFSRWAGEICRKQKFPQSWNFARASEPAQQRPARGLFLVNVEYSSGK